MLRRWRNGWRERHRARGFYVGEIFQGSYADVYLYLKKVAERFGSRVCIFRNHAKVMAGFGNAFDFVIESSANINTNPRTEQTCITIDTGLARFYKEFYDEINNFTKDLIIGNHIH